MAFTQNLIAIYHFIPFILILFFPSITMDVFKIKYSFLDREKIQCDLDFVKRLESKIINLIEKLLNLMTIKRPSRNIPYQLVIKQNSEENDYLLYK
ncbi:hypothetical protein BpHYR1_008053 [Brachionus plicatilis]|uniref:Uncharacterized protein n=1 Tax=Brachionus plicatilis TaxID=10195 RepID=A0A3M7T320_BRAPC|nr:hypothetical protein BpHYR1_008053 [Brachionus plicatilis]